MSSITEALALYDTASAIDRLHFQLRALPPAPAIPPLSEVSPQVSTLAGITAGISDEVNRRLSEGLYSVPAQQEVDAFSSALAPLGEAMTELGRLQREVVFVHFTAPGSAPEIPHPRELTIEVITECRDAAAEILEETAEELRKAAMRLTPSSGAALQSAARARSPHAPVAGPAGSTPTVPPVPAAPTVAPATAKGR